MKKSPKKSPYNSLVIIIGFNLISCFLIASRIFNHESFNAFDILIILNSLVVTILETFYYIRLKKISK